MAVPNRPTLQPAVRQLINTLPGLARKESDAARLRNDDNRRKNSSERYMQRKSIEQIEDATPDALLLSAADMRTIAFVRRRDSDIWNVFEGNQWRRPPPDAGTTPRKWPSIGLELRGTTMSAQNRIVSITIWTTWTKDNVRHCTRSRIKLSQCNLERPNIQNPTFVMTTENTTSAILHSEAVYEPEVIQEIAKCLQPDELATEALLKLKSQGSGLFCHNENLHALMVHEHGPFEPIFAQIIALLDAKASIHLLYGAQASEKSTALCKVLRCEDAERDPMRSWLDSPDGPKPFSHTDPKPISRLPLHMMPLSLVFPTREHILAASFMHFRLEQIWTKSQGSIDMDVRFFVSKDGHNGGKGQILMLIDGKSMQSQKDGMSPRLNLGDRVEVTDLTQDPDDVAIGRVLSQKALAGKGIHIVRITQLRNSQDMYVDTTDSLSRQLPECRPLDQDLNPTSARRLLDEVSYGVTVEVFPDKHMEERVYHNLSKLGACLHRGEVKDDTQPNPVQLLCMGSRPDKLPTINVLADMDPACLAQWRTLIGDRPDQRTLIEYMRALPFGICILAGVPGSGKSEMISVLLAMLGRSAQASNSIATFQAIVTSSINGNLDALADKIRRKLRVSGVPMVRVGRMYTRSTNAANIKLSRDILEDIRRYKYNTDSTAAPRLRATVERKLRTTRFSDERVTAHEIAHSAAFELAERAVLKNDPAFERLRRSLSSSTNETAYHEAVDGAMPLVLRDIHILVCSLVLVNEPRVEDNIKPRICIVDEASRALSLDIEGLKVKHPDAALVLAGDPFQMSVYVQADELFNPWALQERLPLFSRLACLGWPLVFMTESQRFVPGLARMLSAAFYSGVMTPARDETRFSAIIQSRRGLLERAEITHAEVDALCIDLRRSWAMKEDGTYYNKPSAKACIRLVEKLLQSIEEDWSPSIAILTPYKGQEDVLLGYKADEKEKSSLTLSPRWQNVHISTIDKSQGDEWDIVIIDVAANICPMRLDLERLALTGFTRARALLVCVMDWSKINRSVASPCLEKIREAFRTHGKTVEITWGRSEGSLGLTTDLDTYNGS